MDRIVAADDANELYAAQMARRRREERRRSTEDVLGLAKWRFDRVESDGAYDEKGHVVRKWRTGDGARGARGCARGDGGRAYSWSRVPRTLSPVPRPSHALRRRDA